MSKKLVSLIPEHKVYVEAFGGGGSLLFAKEPSDCEIYNDLDSDLVNFFRVLRDVDMFPAFYAKCCFSPFSREEFNFCKKNLNADPDPVERARRFFVVARGSFSGLFGSSFVTSMCSNNGMAQKASSNLSAICMLPLAAERLMRVQIENVDYRRLFLRFDSEHTFYYLDPPYLPETRRSGSYKHEMTRGDHEELIDILRQVKGKVLLSGYPSELYDSLGWNRKEWQLACHAAAQTEANGLKGKKLRDTQLRTEVVWMNY